MVVLRYRTQREESHMLPQDHDTFTKGEYRESSTSVIHSSTLGYVWKIESVKARTAIRSQTENAANALRELHLALCRDISENLPAV